MSLVHLAVESIPQTVRPFVIIALAVGVVCLFVVNVCFTASASKSAEGDGRLVEDQPPSTPGEPVERGAPGRRY